MPRTAQTRVKQTQLKRLRDIATRITKLSIEAKQIVAAIEASNIAESELAEVETPTTEITS